MPDIVQLVNPEWQGGGPDLHVHESTLRAADRLFPFGDVLEVDVPAEDGLDRSEGVVGLDGMAARLQSTVAALRSRAPERIVAVGGTCGTEAAPISVLNEVYEGTLAVLWLDAHADLNTPRTSPSGHFHGMVLRTLLGDGPSAFNETLSRPLRPDQVALVGLRETDPAEADYIASHDVKVLVPDDLTDPTVIVDLLRSMDADHVYLHLDLDVLDPGAFPDTLMHVPGGPSPSEVARAVGMVRSNADVVGASIVEFYERDEGALDRLASFTEAAGFHAIV